MNFARGIARSFWVAAMGSLLVVGSIWGQSGNTQNLPNMNLSTSNPSGTTQTVSASGNTGIVKYTLGKPEVTPPGACIRLSAQILRNNTPALTRELAFCNSASIDIQTNHTGGNATYALRLTRLDTNWNTVPLSISYIKVFFPTSNTPVTLSTPGGLISLAPGNQQDRSFQVPGPGSLMVRVKCSPTVPLLVVLYRGNQELGRTQNSTGSITLTRDINSGGTYRVLIQNRHTRTTTQASIDRVEYTPGS